MTSRDPEIKVTLVTPIRIERNISKTAGNGILQQSLITSESAVRQYGSAILAIAWLLVL